MRERRIADRHQSDALPLCIDQRLVDGAPYTRLSTAAQKTVPGERGRTVVQPEPRELRRVDQAHERHVGGGGNTFVQFALFCDWVFVAVEVGPCDVGCGADVDEVDVPAQVN